MEKVKSNSLKFVLLLIIFLNSCTKKEYNIKDFKKIVMTHNINNEIIKTLFKEIYSLKENYNSNDDIIIIYVKKEELSDKFQLDATFTKFKSFKKNLPFEKKSLKGYFLYKKYPVLLFGDITNYYFKNLEKNKYDVLYINNDENSPPDLYEPSYMSFVIDGSIFEKQ